MCSVTSIATVDLYLEYTNIKASALQNLHRMHLDTSHNSLV
jgi:hypothetical protein